MKSEQTIFVLGFMALSFVISVIRIMVVLYFINELFDREVIAFTIENIFYGWCIYAVLLSRLKIEMKV